VSEFVHDLRCPSADFVNAVATPLLAMLHGGR